MSDDVQTIRQIYKHRFTPESRDEKRRVWAVLVRHFFQQWIAPDAAVLDIGCGFGEFLNHVACGDRVGIDLNPEAAELLASGVEFHCRAAGDLSFLEAERFDIVFVSNFLEHLEHKHAVEELLRGIQRVLRPRGQCLILGPNLRFLPGPYWDYWITTCPSPIVRSWRCWEALDSRFWSAGPASCRTPSVPVYPPGPCSFGCI